MASETRYPQYPIAMGIQSATVLTDTPAAWDPTCGFCSSERLFVTHLQLGGRLSCVWQLPRS